MGEQVTPLFSGEPPATAWDLDAPELYLNRELTWLAFNQRVLHEAEDPRVPLLERLKFIAIVSGNFDEFFMKRIGGLKQQLGAGLSIRTVDGRTPQQQIDECHLLVREIESAETGDPARCARRRWPSGTSVCSITRS